MTQKTFIVNEFNEYVPSVGEYVILIELYNSKTEKSGYYCVKDNGVGIGGNLDGHAKRYHGWRGTTNDVAKYAHGCRKVLKVVSVGEEFSGDFKVTVGKDIKPNED